MDAEKIELMQSWAMVMAIVPKVEARSLIHKYKYLLEYFNHCNRNSSTSYKHSTFDIPYQSCQL